MVGKMRRGARRGPRAAAVLAALLPALVPTTGCGGRPLEVPGDGPDLTGLRIMPLGDSITYGIYVGCGYRTVEWRRLHARGSTGWHFVGSVSSDCGAYGLPASEGGSEGHISAGIGSITEYFPRWWAINPASLIQLHIGVNDLDAPGSAPAALAALDRALGVIASTIDPAVRVYLAQIVPSPSAVAAGTLHPFNQGIPEVAARYRAAGMDLHVVDMEAAPWTKQDFSDDKHPSASGYAKMADVWIDALASDY